VAVAEQARERRAGHEHARAAFATCHRERGEAPCTGSRARGREQCRQPVLELRGEIGIARRRTDRLGIGSGLGRAGAGEILGARVTSAQRLGHASGELVHARAR
jgi:hypothetical protein